MDINNQIVPTLDHVIGQKTAVAVLRTAIDSYFYDRTKSSKEQAFPHVLVTDPLVLVRHSSPKSLPENLRAISTLS